MIIIGQLLKNSPLDPTSLYVYMNDRIVQARTLEILAEVAEARGLGVILVTHDTDIAERWAHRCVALA